MSTSHFGIKEHVINSSYIREYPGALLDDQEDTLQLHVKQYTPSDGSHLLPGAVTVIGAHANAFPKVCLRQGTDVKLFTKEYIGAI